MGETLPIFPAGKLKIVHIEGVADAVSIDIKPDEGYVWQLIDMWAFHDDTFQCAGGKISYTDGVDTISKKTLTMAVGEKYSIYNLLLSNSGCSTTQGNFLISNRVYMTLSVTAIGAGKKLFCDGLVLELAE